LKDSGQSLIPLAKLAVKVKVCHHSYLNGTRLLVGDWGDHCRPN
jgi:hypothetical protein